MTHNTLKKVSYSYGLETVINNINLLIKPGIYRIDGANGSGKTTLLKIIAGVLKPSTGERVITVPTTYLDQNQYDASAAALTVAEHCLISAKKTGVLTTLSLFDHAWLHRGDYFVGELSGGQRQLLSGTIALASNSKIICLDEFTSALDNQSSQALIQHIINRQNQEPITIVYTSHKGSLFANETVIDI